MSGIAALAPEFRWVNDGLELADSYCTNPHKWMGVNFDCNLFWTTDRARPARRTEHPAGVPAVGGGRGGRGDRLPRLADPARPALPGAQAVVRDPLRRCGCVPADDPPPRRAAHRSSPRGSPTTNASRSSHRIRSTCSASRPAATTPQRDALIEAANATGEALFTRTVLDGRSVLRISIGARSTERHHVESAWQLVQHLA